MKKLLLSLVVFCFIAVSASAQQKAMVTTKISTPTVQCEMCKKTIEDLLKRYDGVLAVSVKLNKDSSKRQVVVKYLTDRVNEETLKAAIANAGYDANEIAANPESYKALPKCCKKPEDGGGMPKH
ncbi:MAG TPA: heavy-metal-associated domain-containing protein [Flavisolibacter sp.]|jgi:copper chaperone CopZ|nr:heavy-metal-associated domain-containing protein [Flavisolibacter sp.]